MVFLCALSPPPGVHWAGRAVRVILLIISTRLVPPNYTFSFPARACALAVVVIPYSIYARREDGCEFTFLPLCGGPHLCGSAVLMLLVLALALHVYICSFLLYGWLVSKCLAIESNCEWITLKLCYLHGLYMGLER